MSETVKVIRCHICDWSTSTLYLRNYGRCWNCWEPLDFPKSDKPEIEPVGGEEE